MCSPITVAQPYGGIAGSVVGAAVGTLLSLVARRSLMATVAAVLAFVTNFRSLRRWLRSALHLDRREEALLGATVVRWKTL
jgi:hypothetical protein